jgi:hypothetical protein
LTQIPAGYAGRHSSLGWIKHYDRQGTSPRHELPIDVSWFDYDSDSIVTGAAVKVASAGETGIHENMRHTGIGLPGCAFAVFVPRNGRSAI